MKERLAQQCRESKRYRAPEAIDTDLEVAALKRRLSTEMNARHCSRHRAVSRLAPMLRIYQEAAGPVRQCCAGQPRPESR